MKNIAIIAEYNPMHNGHIYQINQIKEKFPDSSITVLSSGSLVQRGDFSFVNKFLKSKLAIENGIDLLLEMPTIVSLQSADNFAKYSLEILNKLEIIDYLSFGIDSSSLENFKILSDFQLDYSGQIFELQASYIQEGQSYKRAYSKACLSLGQKLNMSEDILREISNPNNTLAFQYVKAIKEINSPIKVLPVIRNDKGYSSNFDKAFENQSASALREMYHVDKDISPYIPENLNSYLENKEDFQHMSLDDLSDIFNYLANIVKKSSEEITGYENGILNLINNNFDGSIEKAVDSSHTKRYSKSRLRRFILNYILDIRNSHIESLDHINYIRPLGFNDKGRDLLRQIKDKEKMAIITKLVDYKNLDKINQDIIEKDMAAIKLIKRPYKPLSDSVRNFHQYDYKHNPYYEKDL